MRYSTSSRRVVPGAQMLRLEAVDFRIAVVGEDQALLGIEHGQALRHVRERHVEVGILCPQLRLVPLQEQVLLLQARVQLLALRHVLVDGDPPALLDRLAGDADDASVAQVPHPDRGLEHGSRPLAVILVGLGLGVDPLADAMAVDILEARSGPGQLGRQAIHICKALVADDDPAAPHRSCTSRAACWPMTPRSGGSERAALPRAPAGPCSGAAAPPRCDAGRSDRGWHRPRWPARCRSRAGIPPRPGRQGRSPS